MVMNEKFAFAPWPAEQERKQIILIVYLLKSVIMLSWPKLIFLSKVFLGQLIDPGIKLQSWTFSPESVKGF